MQVINGDSWKVTTIIEARDDDDTRSEKAATVEKRSASVHVLKEQPMDLLADWMWAL